MKDYLKSGTCWRDKMKLLLIDLELYTEQLQKVLNLIDTSNIDVEWVEPLGNDIEEERQYEGDLIITNSRTKVGSNCNVPVFDLSHGVFWAKSDRTDMEALNKRVDFYVASSNYEYELMYKRGIVDYVKEDVFVCGRPDLDILYELNKDRKPNDKTVVLYAPTWNYELNGGIGQIKRTVQELKRICEKKDWVLEVAIHPIIWQYKLEEWFDNIGVRYRRKGEDFFKFMVKADVLVGDCSSNVTQFMLLDKPIVLYNSFDWFSGLKHETLCNKDEEEMEMPRYKDFRSISYQFTGIQFLEEMLECALKDNESVKIHRRAMRDKLWGNVFDGKATERCAKAVEIAIEKVKKNASYNSK